MQGEMRGRRFCVEQHACYPYPIPIFPLPFLFCNVCRFIGVWQQMSSQRPQRENGATVRASGVIHHTPSLWGIAGTARPIWLLSPYCFGFDEESSKSLVMSS